MENAFAMEIMSLPNLLTMTVMLTYPHCSILVMKVVSKFRILVKKRRTLDSVLKFPNLFLSGGNSAESLSVWREGMDDDAMVPLSKVPTWLNPLIKTSDGGVLTKLGD